jgi:Na+-translocating ferredoxin:NAD+ oxidoreductase RnfG subunit
MRPLDARWWVPLAVVCAPVGAHATQYLTVEQAQRALFPQAERFVPVRVELSDAQRSRIAELSAVNSPRGEQSVWRVLRGQALVGYFIVDEVIGKHELITYALGIGDDGRARGVEILDYREPRGGEVRDTRWRAQFKGKRAGDTLRVGQDIQNLSGATLSSRHITDGVRRLLALYEVVLKGR